MVIDKDNIKILLIILIAGLGLGYAYINSDLNINGTARVDHANWDVHWANIQVTNGSVSGSNVVTQPTISNGTTVNYSIILPVPGSFYEFTVDAVNGGAIDAMIDNMEFKINGVTVVNPPAYLNYSITYSDGVPLEQNHELLANTTETYRIKIEYRTDIELNQLPTANQTLLLSSGVTYRQATDDATEVDHSTTRYTANIFDETPPYYNRVFTGQAISNGITQYLTGAEALAALRLETNNSDIQFYLKHTIENGIVTESYIEFIVTPEMASANSGMTAGTYSIRGITTYDENSPATDYCKTEYFNGITCQSPYYEDNKTTMLNAFGSSRCSVTETYTRCAVTNLTVYTEYIGSATARNSNWYCTVDSTYDFSDCEHD